MNLEWQHDIYSSYSRVRIKILGNFPLYPMLTGGVQDPRDVGIRTRTGNTERFPILRFEFGVHFAVTIENETVVTTLTE
jgi:hypothetical protein